MKSTTGTLTGKIATRTTNDWSNDKKNGRSSSDEKEQLEPSDWKKIINDYRNKRINTILFSFGMETFLCCLLNSECAGWSMRNTLAGASFRFVLIILFSVF